jgi:hypothetical protein
MTIIFQRPINASGVWSGGQQSGASSGPGLTRIVRAPSGPAGRNALAGMTFDFAGLVSPSEANLPRVAPFAGTLSAANSVARCKVAATSTSVFTIYQNGSAIGTVTFSAGSLVGTISLTSSAYAKGDYFEVSPPPAGDSTLYGAAITLLGS